MEYLIPEALNCYLSINYFYFTTKTYLKLGTVQKEITEMASGYFKKDISIKRSGF